ncbi:MAG: PEP-CTERM sorting domain-containing protein [Candidatus Korobacteraceae bacterium]
MKKIIVGLILLSVTLFASPAAAQVLYSNGPTNGNTDAWTINFGFVVSDSFTVNSGTTITGATFAMWLAEGDTLTSAELSITSLGTSYFNQTVYFAQSDCTSNQYGYNVCQENTSFNGPTLNSGTYWLTLQNASVPSGDPVYWDENSGPSSALECCGRGWPNAVGTIPSESFTLMGFSTFPGKNGSPQSSTPEPSSILVLGSGILGVAAAWRLKIHR